MTLSSVWICWSGAVTFCTPGWPLNRVITWLGVLGHAGVHQ